MRTKIRTAGLTLTFVFAGVAVLMVLAVLGMPLSDRAFQPEPLVMEPGPPPAATRMTGLTPTLLVPRTVEMTVGKVDHDRFVRTLKKDVVVHGGWAENPSKAQQKFAVTVPAGYLERIESLMQPSGPGAPHPDYRKWAAEVSTRPERLTEADPVQVSFNIQHPEFYNRSHRQWSIRAFLAFGIALAFAFLAAGVYAVADAQGKPETLPTERR